MAEIRVNNVKNRLSFFALTLLCCSVLGWPVSGQDLRPGMIGEDDRVRVDKQGSPWDAIGVAGVVGHDVEVDV